MAGLFKRLGNGKEDSENESATKLYGSLRALRSPLRSNTPTKRRSRSLELPSDTTVRESGHSRYPSAQESSFRRPTSPLSRSSPSGVPHHTDPSSRHRAVTPVTDESHSGQATPTKKKRGNFLSRALSSLRNSAVYPGHSTFAATTPKHTSSAPATSTATYKSPTSPRLSGDKLPHSKSQARERPSSPAVDLHTAASNLAREVAKQSPLPESDSSPPASEEHTSTSMSAGDSNPSQHYLPLSASEPGPSTSGGALRSGHITNSTSDPGPGGVDTTSRSADGRPAVHQRDQSRDEAYQRLVKAERRKSPLAKIIPPLFRRNSTEVKSDRIAGRVSSPMRRIPTKEDSRTTPRTASTEFGEPSTSRTKVTSVGSATQISRPRPSRHQSFDFEQHQSNGAPLPPAPPEGKVRFVEPVIEEGSHDGDSGVSGLRSEAGHGPSQHGKQPESNAHPSKAEASRRPYSSPRHPPVSIDAPRHTRRARVRDASLEVPTSGHDHHSVPISSPLGTTFTSHGLPLFSFESTNLAPSSSSTSFAPYPTARSVPAESSMDMGRRRRDKGRSLDLAIGLAWAPKKVREDALLTFGHGASTSKSKWGVDARMSEVLLGADMQEFGVTPKQSVMHAFRQVLDEPGYLTFKRYCRRYEVGALPLGGPTGVLGHLERLLDSAAEIGPKEKRRLLDQFTQFAAER